MGDYTATKLLFNTKESVFHQNHRGEIRKQECYYGLSSEEFVYFRAIFKRFVILQNIMVTNSVLPDDVKRVICSFIPDPELSWENVPNSCGEHNMWVDDICPDCGECPVCSTDDIDWMYCDDHGGNSYYERKQCDTCYEMVENGNWPDGD